MNPIELSQVGKKFGVKPALQGLDMKVEPGEFVGLIGPNGSGKSTCLRLLLGIIRRDSGQIRVLGMDPNRDSLRIRENCSYLPGETSVYQGMRGREFLHFALSFYPTLQDDVMEELMEGFALPLQKRVHTYSAGMKQKLALMASLIPDVEIYILDEPDRALDASVRFFLRSMLRKLNARKKTILLSSHHLSEIEALSNRQVFLMEGTAIEAARVEEARKLLERRVRLRLRDGVQIPSDAEEIRRDVDGTVYVVPHGDPVGWLAQIPTGAIISAEMGVVHLEDLYSLLVVEKVQ